MTDWSADQAAALDKAGRWIKRPNGQQIFRLFGYAGTGKTTLAKHLAESEDNLVLYAAYTGKAAMVMRQKGCGGASTIHSMIYEVKQHADGHVTFELNTKSEVRKASLVIIDECSMVGEELAGDLLSFGTPILALGDPAQLPPVKGAGFFTDAKPDAMLTEVHRQARGNPIIHMATKARNGLDLQRGEYEGCEVVSGAEFDEAEIGTAEQILCGLNRTRTRLNREIRQNTGRAPDMPEKGDRLVCLRNSHSKGLLNGSLWTVDDVNTSQHDRYVHMLVTSADFEEAGKCGVQVLPEFFEGRENELPWHERRESDEFDFGYALTCHKAQGSQWDSVLLFDEAAPFREHSHRWRYTAITPAAKTITVVQ